MSGERTQIDRLSGEIGELAGFSAWEAPAVTRVLFSEEDLEARAWLVGKFEAAGLVVRTDGVGNIFARWVGSEPELPAVATGSHIDAIPNAGGFEGVVGVLGGLEAVRRLRAAGFAPRRSIEVVMFTAEEPTRFGLGCLGSRLLAGALDGDRAAGLTDEAGVTLAELRAEVGCEGTLAGVRLGVGFYEAFVELHIEQGPILERQGVAIGAVEKIAAPAAFRVRVEGEGGHAGAVLMPARRDAGCAAAEIVLAVERAARESGSADTVGTTGVLRLEPGAINSVPVRATLEIDLRDTSLETRDGAEAAIRAAVGEVAARRGVTIVIETINSDSPAICDADLVDSILAVAEAEGLSAMRMISRAYHDSLFMAQICPTAMVFIPCRNGWSHRPDEFASAEAIDAGVRVLAGVLRGSAG
jgi:N-carbamoyl-L-amino-acid hydrolase